MRYLYFTSKDCVPCQAIKPKIMRHEEIAIIDVEKDGQLVSKYGVMSVPTLLIINDDDSVETQFTGTKINKWLKENFRD